MPHKKIVQLSSRFLQNLYFRIFLNGILLASFVCFSIEAQYDNQLFSAIHEGIRDSLPKNYKKSEFAKKALSVTYFLQESRYLIFKTQKVQSIKSTFFHPATFDLMTGKGACSSYAIVLARILVADNIPVKIGQMKANGYYGSHIFVEAKTEYGWVVLDPMFNLIFKNKNGRLATFAELQQNWKYYKSQIPANYDTSYKYEDARYTNWHKIPVIGSIVKSSLNFIVGKEKTNRISLRPYFLKSYYILAWVTAMLFVLNAASILQIIFRRKSFHEKKPN